MTQAFSCNPQKANYIFFSWLTLVCDIWLTLVCDIWLHKWWWIQKTPTTSPSPFMWWIWCHVIINKNMFAVPVYVCCRRGNDSQQAVLILRGALEDYCRQSEMLVQVKVQDIIGGLTEWTQSVDPAFPRY